MNLHTALLIYPHQLYAPHPASQPDRLHVLIEDSLFFGDGRYPLRFHKQKLMLHRAAMRRYQDERLAQLPALYIDFATTGGGSQAVFEILAQRGIRHIVAIDPVDWALERRIRRYCRMYQLDLTWLESPNFLTTPAQIDAYYDAQKRPRYHQTDFYIWQRQRLGILLDATGRPQGGRWTYDTENRQKLRPDVPVPDAPAAQDNAYVREARAYVEQHFPQHPGSTAHFIYPTGHAEAESLLRDFLAHKLRQYGPYQDAITARADVLFHSLLSAPLNTGLLDPQQIVQAALEYATQQAVPIASLEGFLRQIVGWREFMRAVYQRAGVQQRTGNFFHQMNGLSAAWYDATTGMPPVDDAIRKAQRLAYNHHIERLMLIGNLMALCEIHPDAVYRWFMEMFIDAYDWVMVPNVYGMSQYADGGLITTKPYISSSNYIRKMSDYGRGAWEADWDGLYWRFIAKHRDFFSGNPRLSMMTAHLNRMGEPALRQHIATAEAYLQRLNTPAN